MIQHIRNDIKKIINIDEIALTSLLNLCPGSYAEAVTLIPALKGQDQINVEKALDLITNCKGA